MRTLLVGTDFMYNSSGNLVPIEINTNIGIDKTTIEERDEIFDLTYLRDFIISNNFIKVTYIGGVKLFSEKLAELCQNIPIEYDYIPKGNGVTIPYVEDSADHLIIRSSYDMSAIVDEEYCKVKPNFLNLIKSKSFKSQFAYMDENGILINNITSIPDNGNEPNFILKSVYPDYNRDVYPKFYKVTNTSELDVILQNITPEYFLMENHYNESKLYFNHLKVIRSYNLLFPPNLNSLKIGQYTKITSRSIDGISEYDTNTFELNNEHRTKYLTSDGGINGPKLLDTDRVEMADGTFKTALEIQNDDIIKTVIIPNPEGIDLANDIGNFHITYDEFVSGTTYSTNRIINKTKVDKLVDYITIHFTDGTTWEDTVSSHYLALRNDEVRFLTLDQNDTVYGLQQNDDVILIDTSNDIVVNSVLKKMDYIEKTRTIFSGWEFTVEVVHIFLTQSESQTTSYAAIEHNPASCVGPDYSCTRQEDCIKGKCCCEGICASCM
jgi:hypothetical protein